MFNLKWIFIVGKYYGSIQNPRKLFEELNDSQSEFRAVLFGFAEMQQNEG